MTSFQQQQQQSSPSQSLFYNAVMAAPMVRVSTLAFRLLCAHYGSSVVFTEELVAAKLMKCKRRYLPEVEFLLEHEDKTKVPEQFTKVLQELKVLMKGGTITVHDEDDGSKQKISDIIFKWMKMFPFLAQTLFAGRVEGIYIGHQQPQQKSQKTIEKAETDTDAAAIITEGEEKSIQGEMVFTTLAELSSSREKKNKDNSDFFSLMKSHCRDHLKFSKKEAGKPLIGQIGASEGKVAVAGFHLLAPFVSAADTNMGCPKAFSVKNGMGAALMANQCKATEIMKGLAEAFPFLPVSYKTRLFEDVNQSYEHLKACFEATGKRMHAYTIHSRNRPQRSETAPLYQDALALVKMIRNDENLKNLCLIFNGSVGMRSLPGDDKETTADNHQPVIVETERKEIDVLLSSSLCGNQNVLNAVNSYGFNGALLARSSMWKPSVFLSEDEEKKLPLPSSSSSSRDHYHHDVIQTLLREFQSLMICYAACGDQVRLLKYHLTRAIPEYQSAQGVTGRGEQVKRLANEINEQIWFPVRDGKTLSDFAKALKFNQDEIDALNWMNDLMNWRRSANLMVNESWDPYLMTVVKETGKSAPSRRERDDENKDDDE